MVYFFQAQAVCTDSLAHPRASMHSLIRRSVFVLCFASDICCFSRRLFFYFMNTWDVPSKNPMEFKRQSMDHRGTPEFPGLVATLISDSDLEVHKSTRAYVEFTQVSGVSLLDLIVVLAAGGIHIMTC